MRAAAVVTVGFMAAITLSAPAGAAELKLGLRVEATTPGDAAHWGAWLDDGASHATLRVIQSEDDADLPGVRNVRYEQLIEGIPVFGAQAVRQIDASGVTRTVLGRLSQGGAVDTRPSVSEERAVRTVEADLGAGSEVVGTPSLVILPLQNRRDLAYMMWGRADKGISLERYFVSAQTGEILFHYSDLQTATKAVGIGTGVWGDRKKLGVQFDGGTYFAEDRLRPAPFTTYNMNFDQYSYYYGNWASFVARDSDNDWTDGAVVDAHVYAGLTYDYYYRQLGRDGINGHNLPVKSFVHVVQDYVNAFWDPSSSTMTYGDGGTEYGVHYRPLSAALDVVAHELTHGVTDYSWRGIYYGEPGALNEAFSDIMGASVEFYFQPVGDARDHADYWLGEDIAETFNPGANAFRSLAHPTVLGQPDNYSVRYLGSIDNGGVHINSGIANNAFYLLIEGGTNRVSGLHVDGLGAANRDKAERIFYRAFTHYLTPSATFSDARQATIRAATDLFGAGTNEVLQTARSWTAVGVN
jgi:bacillolysin